VTPSEWNSSTDPEPMLQSLPVARLQGELRLFAIRCVRRVWDWLPEVCRQAVEASEDLARGRITEQEHLGVLDKATATVQELFPGRSAPDAREYAASAAIDASSIWPRTVANILATISCAASAVACGAAETAGDQRYDSVFDDTLQAELAIQARLLRESVCFLPIDDAG
jgi:hypothetical protein